MGSDAFEPPAEEEPTGLPARQAVDVSEGLPSIGDLLNETIEDMANDIGPYLLAGVSFYGVVLVVSLVGVFGLYACLIGAIFGAIGIGAAIGDELGAIVTTLGMTVGSVVLTFGFIGLLTLTITPMQASLERAMLAHLRGEEPLSLTSPFTTLTSNLTAVLMVAVLSVTAGLVGLLVVYVGAFVAAWLLYWANPLVVLDERRPAEALRASASAVWDGPPGAGLFTFLVMLLSGIASNIPLVGPMFAIALRVRAHDALFHERSLAARDRSQ